MMKKVLEREKDNEGIEKIKYYNRQADYKTKYMKILGEDLKSQID
jgi:hypothetical protein